MSVIKGFTTLVFIWLASSTPYQANDDIHPTVIEWNRVCGAISQSRLCRPFITGFIEGYHQGTVEHIYYSLHMCHGMSIGPCKAYQTGKFMRHCPPERALVEADYKRLRQNVNELLALDDFRVFAPLAFTLSDALIATFPCQDKRDSSG